MSYTTVMIWRRWRNMSGSVPMRWSHGIPLPGTPLNSAVSVPASRTWGDLTPRFESRAETARERAYLQALPRLPPTTAAYIPRRLRGVGIYSEALRPMCGTSGGANRHF